MLEIFLSFCVTYLILSFQEVRLYRSGKITYKTLVNSLSILLVGLLGFIILHYLFKIVIKL